MAESDERLIPSRFSCETALRNRSMSALTICLIVRATRNDGVGSELVHGLSMLVVHCAFHNHRALRFGLRRNKVFDLAFDA